MARNKSEQGPRRPDPMEDEAITACFDSIIKGQAFRVWYHSESLYTRDSDDSLAVGNQSLYPEEEAAVSGPGYLDFTCSQADDHYTYTDSDPSFGPDHAPLFHAVEAL